MQKPFFVTVLTLFANSEACWQYKVLLGDEFRPGIIRACFAFSEPVQKLNIFDLNLGQ